MHNEAVLNISLYKYVLSYIYYHNSALFNNTTNALKHLLYNTTMH